MPIRRLVEANVLRICVTTPARRPGITWWRCSLQRAHSTPRDNAAPPLIAQSTRRAYGVPLGGEQGGGGVVQERPDELFELFDDEPRPPHLLRL